MENKRGLSPEVLDKIIEYLKIKDHRAQLDGRAKRGRGVVEVDGISFQLDVAEATQLCQQGALRQKWENRQLG